MAEPFKNQLGQSRINVIARHLKRSYPSFPEKSFLATALSNLDELSLMERSRQITDALQQCLPSDFSEACYVLEGALAPEDNQCDELGIHGWLSIPLCDYVGRESHKDINQALKTLAVLTPYFSSEWGIRHILIDRFELAASTLKQWLNHDSEHVRRLVSEGSRPRLPWGIQLKNIIENPELTYPLLDALKDDESEYVRKSVANHLNDYSKDHADWLIKKIKPWWQDKQAPLQRKKLIRHGLRSLIKAGHGPTLELLGYKALSPNTANLSLGKKSVIYGESLEFHLELDMPSKADAILDYAIHFKKSNGDLSPKVFKWKVCKLKKGAQSFKKKHTIKPITTRRYYNGQHKIEVLLNGESIAIEEFKLSGVS